MSFSAVKPIVSSLLLLCAAAHLCALDIWRHPEIAGKNSVFADVGMAPLVFADPGFPVIPLDLRFDYVPPLPVPLSMGLFFKTPDPNLKHFGTRVAYHFDINDPLTDIYFAHVFDFGFIRNDLLVKYNDTPTDVSYFDFRVGVRRFFGPLLPGEVGFIGVAVENDFKFTGMIFMLSIKIH